VNCGVIIALNIVPEESEEYILLDLIDNIILGFYVLECFIKMIG